MKSLSRSGINYFVNPDRTQGYTWNPIKARDGGFLCTKVSPGCLNCWAGQQRHRFQGEDYSYKSKKLDLVLDEEILTAPLRLRKPSIIGVQFMSDLFHEDVSDEMIDKVFAVMNVCSNAGKGHTFIVLTKRADRMNRWFFTSGIDYERPMPVECVQRRDDVAVAGWDMGLVEKYHLPDEDAFCNVWPLPNVILMVSAENQEMADLRIPDLLATPAAKRGVSVEPMLAPVDLSEYFDWGHETGGPQGWQPEPGPDWVVCGCESGRGRRPMDLDWVRSLRDQCVAADVPFWFKQAYENGKLVQLPYLDGKQWKQRPADSGKE
jgi:protein gp37